MGPLRHSRVEIKVVGWNASGCPSGTEHWLDVPASLDTTSVEAFVMSRFGQPDDIAITPTGAHGGIVRGWVYPAQADILQLADGADSFDAHGQLLLVPFVRFADGTRRELFAYSSELNHSFGAAIGSIDAGQFDVESLPPSDRRARLADERCWLASCEPEVLELQIAGWLRRMLNEGCTYLILEAPASGRYVQFLTHDGDWLRGEAVGDAYLEVHQLLTEAERRRLSAIGWRSPMSHADMSGNHWLEWGDPAGSGGRHRVGDDDVSRAAMVATRTLIEAFGPVRMHDVDVRTGTAAITDD